MKHEYEKATAEVIEYCNDDIVTWTRTCEIEQKWHEDCRSSYSECQVAPLRCDEYIY